MSRTVAAEPAAQRAAERAARASAWVLAAVAAAAVLLTTGPLPALTHVRLLVVRSDSMAPAMRTGDLVVLHELAADAAPALHAGQTVTFHAGGKLITHRIVSVGADGRLVTKGDNNATPDTGPVAPSDVAGTLVAVIAGLGYVMALLRTPAPWLALLGWFVWIDRRAARSRRATARTRRPVTS